MNNEPTSASANNAVGQLRLPPSLDVASIELLLRTARLVPEVGIKIAQLGEVEIDGVAIEYSTALIKDRVGAHVHMLGAETYIISSGVGQMHIGKAQLGERGPSVAWEEPVKVAGGDVFTIPAGYAHSLENLGQAPLVIVFFGSPRNLTSDRVIVDNP